MCQILVLFTIGSLSENHQENSAFGTSLSKQFARLPLWPSHHPSNIGGFLWIFGRNSTNLAPIDLLVKTILLDE